MIITFLYTRDLSRSAAFYTDIMGFRLWRDQGSCRIYHVEGNAYIGICHRDDVSPLLQGIIFTIVTEAVDEWYRRLKDKGVVFEKPPQENPKFRIYHCFLRDPDGYLIEI